MIQQPVRCVEFVELVTDWMEGALSDPIRAEVEEHLSICPHCTEYVRQIRTTVTLLRGLDQDPPPPAAREALLTAFRSRPAS